MTGFVCRRCDAEIELIEGVWGNRVLYDRRVNQAWMVCLDENGQAIGGRHEPHYDEAPSCDRFD